MNIFKHDANLESNALLPYDTYIQSTLKTVTFCQPLAKICGSEQRSFAPSHFTAECALRNKELTTGFISSENLQCLCFSFIAFA